MLLGLVLAACLPQGEAAQAPDFDHDILPILWRQGCSAAECHGGATGRGRFKLSLFGSDPDADYAAIVRDLDGRRLDHVAPERSLLLSKPSRAMAHEGGLRLERTSPAFDALRRWIEAGAPRRGEPRELRALGLDVREGAARVQATFQSKPGTWLEDVTDRAVLTIQPETVAQLDGTRVVRRGPGRAWLIARYAGRTARQELLTPFTGTAGGADSTEELPEHALDRAWLKDLARLGLDPADRAPPDALVRRVYLNLVGRPATPAERRAFLEAPDVARTAGRLLDSDEFVAWWGGELADWFEIPAPARELVRNADRNRGLRAQVQKALGQGFSGQEASLFDAAGAMASEQGAFLGRFGDPRDRAEFVGRAFLGRRIGCARCHDHPLDRWRQGDHLGFSAFVAGGEGRVFDERTGAAVRARPLDMNGDGRGNTVKDLAAFLGGPARPAVARNFANRVLRRLLGGALVEPVDDLRLSNPARSPAVLDAAADAFERFDGDLRRFVLWVVASRLYALGAESSLTVEWRVRYLAARPVVRMEPRLLARSVRAVLGVPAIAELPVDPLAVELALLDSGTLRQATGDSRSTVQGILAFGDGPRSWLRDLFVTVLGREPRREEIAALLPRLEGAKGEAGARELARALILCREFGSVR